MTATMRTTATLLALGILLLVAALWAWGQVTKPFPKSVEVPACSDTAVPAGSKVFPDQVLVNVLNAGTRSGLAGRTMTMLEGKKFAAGSSGNAPRSIEVVRAEVWAEDQANPAARLVASYLGVEVVAKPASQLEPGITVVVGDEFDTLNPGKKFVKAKRDSTICSPPDSL